MWNSWLLFRRALGTNNNCPWRQCLSNQHFCCSLTFNRRRWFQLCYTSKFLDSIHTKIQINLPSGAPFIQSFFFFNSLGQGKISTLKYFISSFLQGTIVVQLDWSGRVKWQVTPMCFLCFNIPTAAKFLPLLVFTTLLPPQITSSSILKIWKIFFT